MKKTALFLLVLCVVAAFAYNWDSRPVWEQAGNAWQGTSDAQKWLDKTPQGSDVRLYEAPAAFQFLDECFVYQWLTWGIEGAYELWRVENIGTYAGIGPHFWFNSNGNVTVTFTSFGDLWNAAWTNKVEKYYAFGDWGTPPVPNSPDWWTGTYTYGPSQEWDTYMFEAVTVGCEDAPGDYYDYGTITFSMGTNPVWPF
jgi:hypothetical protein